MLWVSVLSLRFYIGAGSNIASPTIKRKWHRHNAKLGEYRLRLDQLTRTSYPYPLFGVLNTWQRVLLFGTSAALMTGSTMVLKWVYGKLNGIEEFQREATKPVKLE